MATRTRKPHPKVSILMPAYRAHGTIERAMQSVRQQSMADWELIIASDDGFNYAKVYSEGDPRIVHAATAGYARGGVAARNAALAKSRGDYVLLLEAHDELHPQKLESLLPLVERHGFALDTVACVEGGGETLACPWAGESEAFTTEPRELFDLNSPIFPMIHRGLVTGWREDLSRGADLVLYLNVALALDEIAVEPRALHRHYVQPYTLRYGRNTAEEYANSYAYILERLDVKYDALGFQPMHVPAVREVFERKLARAQAALRGEAAFPSVDLELQTG